MSTYYTSSDVTWGSALDIGLEEQGVRADVGHLAMFCTDALQAVGTSLASARSVAEALSETSARGVDSHGVRLLPHYVRMARSGRINPRAQAVTRRTRGATGVVDADNGFGHHASFLAVELGISIARDFGTAAISVVNSSHFGAAGCYVLRAARANLVAFAFCNSDSYVTPHDGTTAFHGTNPIGFAAPVNGGKPILVDMATSVAPWNRVQLMRETRQPLDPGVAVDVRGEMTLAPEHAAALLPLGGLTFGHKGAALASMVEIISSVMIGAPFCSELLAMIGPDNSTPRRLGHFFIVLNPGFFVESTQYDRAMAAYLKALRSQSARSGKTVMAPGDREWRVEDDRRLSGVPIDAATIAELNQCADELGIGRLRCRSSGRTKKQRTSIGDSLSSRERNE
jgi:LDH2 family malate/lactate/ureidoglycolate dehydrogenase